MLLEDVSPFKHNPNLFILSQRVFIEKGPFSNSLFKL